MCLIVGRGMAVVVNNARLDSTAIDTDSWTDLFTTFAVLQHDIG
jgi:hypothetical protein